MEDGGGERPKDIVVSRETEYLGEDKNILNQEPFSDACEAVSKKTTIPLANARRILIGMVKNSSGDSATGIGHTPTDGFAEKTPKEQERILDRYSGKAHSDAGLPKREFPRSEKLEAVKIIFRELFYSPHWGEYLGIRINGNEYDNHGDPKDSVKHREPVEGYVKWLVRRQTAKENAKLIGIGEVFPKSIQSRDANPTSMDL